MSKFYSFLTLLICFVAFGASAQKSVVFTIDTPAAVQIYITDGSRPAWEGNSFIYTFEEGVGANIGVNNGYELVSVTVDGTNLGKTTYLNYNSLSDRGTVVIATQKKAPKNIIIHGDPNMVYGECEYVTFDASTNVDGTWTFENVGEYSSTNIYARPGYAIESVKDQNGKEYLSYGSVYIYHGDIKGTLELTVSAYDKNERRSAAFSLEVDGDPSVVYVSRNGESDQLDPADFDNILFNPETELPITIRHSNYYNYNLYKVELNGEPVASEGSQYRLYDIKDGDHVKVTTDFPDVDVPVNVNIVNEGTAGAITLRVNNVIVPAETWTAEGFTIKLGQSYSISINSGDYEVNSLTVNGSEVYYSYSNIVNSEDPIEIVLDATVKEPYKVTIYIEDPSLVTVYRAWTGEVYTLTGEETTIEVSPGTNLVRVVPADGYIATLYDEATGNEISKEFTVYSDMEVSIYVEKFERNLDCVVFIEDASWAVKYLTLSPSNYDLRTTVDLYPGYNFFQYCTQDVPFGLSFYGPDYKDAYVYLNGERLTDFYNNPLLNEMPENSVFKAYTSEPAEHTVTYTIDEDTNVAIFHDYISAVEQPDTHTVLSGTHVVVYAAATADETEESHKTGLQIFANNEAVSADESGRYVIPVSEDTNIDIKAAEAGGVADVATDAAVASDAVYNLQGICLGQRDRLSSLPAGVYIVGGKKVNVRH